MFRWSSFLVVLVFFAAGCAESEPPIAGGKTAEHWIEELKNPKVEVRVTAVKKLGNIGSKDPEALPAIYEALADSSPAVRKVAIYAVARNRPASREGWPLLEEMKDNDKDPGIRKIAEEAFNNLTDGK